MQHAGRRGRLMASKKKPRGIRKASTIARIREYQRDYHRELREQAIANGDCSVCAQRPATDGFRTCAPCRESERERSAKRRLLARKKRLCARCHVRPWTKGYKTCAECREANP